MAFESVGWFDSLSNSLKRKFVDAIKTKTKVDFKFPFLPGVKVSPAAEIDPVKEFIAFLEKDNKNLKSTITKFKVLFEALDGLPQTMKPVIVIGMVCWVVESILPFLFSECYSP